MAFRKEEGITQIGEEEKIVEIDRIRRRKFTLFTKRWMYDFMVQFLSSPIWRVSILDFVDNKCIVFDN